MLWYPLIFFEFINTTTLHISSEKGRNRSHYWFKVSKFSYFAFKNCTLICVSRNWWFEIWNCRSDSDNFVKCIFKTETSSALSSHRIWERRSTVHLLSKNYAIWNLISNYNEEEEEVPDGSGNISNRSQSYRHS